MYDDEKLSRILCDTVCAGGAEIMAIYRNADDVHIKQKGDGSPLTNADIAANQVITHLLAQNFPDIPIISEESDINMAASVPRQFFLVDPLDGTKEFISRNGEFTVNVALITDGQACDGAIYAPTQQKLYFTKGNHAYRKIGGEATMRIQVSKIQNRVTHQKIRAIVSRSHFDEATDKFLQKFSNCETISAGSSLKLCLIAEGNADIYPRFGRTMEWDIAAGHALLQKAGGFIAGRNGSEFFYGKKDYANVDGFIAYGDETLLW
ncbi:MAG: 3'(2'),5'-bisphosphate nucleotidase CysQ [Alphaproteobacteria bacterium]|nr:3'(2'),5'-bisphosphate nucleotidase CysQ [Alphaproteobacteria bacterium]